VWRPTPSTSTGTHGGGVVDSPDRTIQGCNAQASLNAVTVVPPDPRRPLVFVVLAVASCHSSAARHDAAIAPAPPHLMCQEQILHVQPVPTGIWRERYLTQCLLEHDFRAYVRERSWCNDARDCTIVRTQCPFGCGVVVAMEYATAVSAEHDRLLGEFNKTAYCMYKCLPVTSVQCVEHRCSP
jgi:hypothetical protein